MLFCNLHTHTTFSDGENTPEEMIRQGIREGLLSIGISDHSETPFDPGYCLTQSRYDAYVAEISRLKGCFGAQIDVLCGIEQDAFSPALKAENFDFVIGSVHYIFADGRYWPVDHKAVYQLDAIREWGSGDKMAYARRYFQQVAAFAASGAFQILGHFDLVNKFSLFEADDPPYRSMALEALDAALEKDLFFEVNTGGLSRGYGNLYPAPFLLSRLLEKGGRIVLNSDSHSAKTLTAHFDSTLTRLKEIGFSSLWQLSCQGWNERTI